MQYTDGYNGCRGRSPGANQQRMAAAQSAAMGCGAEEAWSLELGVPTGTLILLCLVEVFLDHCHRMRRVGAQLTLREADKVGGTVGREGNNNVAWA